MPDPSLPTNCINCFTLLVPFKAFVANGLRDGQHSFSHALLLLHRRSAERIRSKRLLIHGSLPPGKMRGFPKGSTHKGTLKALLFVSSTSGKRELLYCGLIPTIIAPGKTAIYNCPFHKETGKNRYLHVFVQLCHLLILDNICAHIRRAIICTKVKREVYYSIRYNGMLLQQYV